MNTPPPSSADADRHAALVRARDLLRAARVCAGAAAEQLRGYGDQADRELADELDQAGELGVWIADLDQQVGSSRRATPADRLELLEAAIGRSGLDTALCNGCGRAVISRDDYPLCEACGIREAGATGPAEGGGA